MAATIAWWVSFEKLRTTFSPLQQGRYLLPQFLSVGPDKAVSKRRAGNSCRWRCRTQGLLVLLPARLPSLQTTLFTFPVNMFLECHGDAKP
ncbi:hypothetical protein E2C01_045130 [Portunus trituberculatus]|uniref:Uncharacterized protein n=1 Tax=Portunus trituberculatus TaxID=210409 RepID=A0A5B7G0F2_PORTR|nr:hypothetical protein [Portunus trituberculatus]